MSNQPAKTPAKLPSMSDFSTYEAYRSAYGNAIKTHPEFYNKSSNAATDQWYEKRWIWLTQDGDYSDQIDAKRRREFDEIHSQPRYDYDSDDD